MIIADNKANRAAYEAQLPNLRQSYPQGHFAVYASAALVGAYPSYAEALRQGYDRAGFSDFFVKQITETKEAKQVVTPFATS